MPVGYSAHLFPTQAWWEEHRSLYLCSQLHYFFRFELTFLTFLVKKTTVIDEPQRINP